MKVKGKTGFVVYNLAVNSWHGSNRKEQKKMKEKNGFVVYDLALNSWHGTNRPSEERLALLSMIWPLIVGMAAIDHQKKN